MTNLDHCYIAQPSFFIRKLSECRVMVMCLWFTDFCDTKWPIWLLQIIVQEARCIIGICLCDLCVLYLSNNANWNEYQNCDFGEGGHREDCFGRKIPERWVPWPHYTSGHNCGILRIKVLQLEQLCFWQTNFFIISCRTLDIDGREVKLGVWDTAGSERYDTITRMYYRYH